LIVIFISTLLSLIIFPNLITKGYADEEVNGDCVISGIPSLYNKTITARNFNTPCNSFSGELDYSDGTTFTWGTSGYWLALTTCIASIATFLVTFPTCFNLQPFNPTRRVVTTTSVVTSSSVVSPAVMVTPTVTPVVVAPTVVPVMAPQTPVMQRPLPSTWASVQQFLIDNQLSDCIEAFRANAFDWQTFMAFPSMAAQDQDRVVSQIGAKMRVITAIQNFQQQQYQRQQQQQLQFQQVQQQQQQYQQPPQEQYYQNSAQF